MQIEIKKNQTKIFTKKCKKLLAELKIKGIVEDEMKKLPKKFKSKMQECITQ